jgi:hypothetical protein
LILDYRTGLGGLTSYWKMHHHQPYNNFAIISAVDSFMIIVQITTDELFVKEKLIIMTEEILVKSFK